MTPTPQPPAEETRPAPISAASILCGRHATGLNGVGELLACSVRQARRFGVSAPALDVVRGLPLRRWSAAVAAARPALTGPAVWVETVVPAADFGLPADSVVSVGVLLSPMHPRHRGVKGMGAFAVARGGRTQIEYSGAEVCPLLRGRPVPDLVAAWSLLMQGMLIAVENPEPWGVGAGLPLIITPSGVGTA